MNKVMVFNYCSIPVLIIVLLTTFIRKTTKGTSNRLFIGIFSITLFTGLVDIIADGYEAFLPLNSTWLILVTVANYIYFVGRNLVSFLYLIFLFSFTRTTFRFRSHLFRFFLITPYLILLLVLFTNPIHHKTFTITSEEGYIRGSLVLVFYVVSLFYSGWGLIHLFHCFKIIRFGKWLALISMYLLSFIGLAIQLINPDLLIEIFGIAISSMFVVLVVLRPEEITDSNVGISNFKAYSDELHKISVIHRPVIITVVQFINSVQVREYLGEIRFNEYIQKIALAFENYQRENKIHSDFYYESPGTFYFISDGTSPKIQQFDYNKAFDFLSEELRKDNVVKQFSLYLIPRMCRISYPQEISMEEEIIHMGHAFTQLLPENKNVIKASELLENPHYELDRNLSSILKRAVSENLFEMYYQPIYSIKDDKFCAAEALIRLTDKDFGPISPDIFIPAAEKNGLILSVGDFVLETVFKFISSHNFSELGLNYIEINLSVAQCVLNNFEEKIHKLQEKYNVSPSFVNFEITETTFSAVSNMASENIRKLEQSGYSFSLDDYGTGYSNMQRIVKLPLSLIKLDKSLIDEMDSQKVGSLVRNTIKMMQDIKTHVLAEGVEKKEQLEQLKEMGCDYIQGFYFSKALPEKEFIAFLKEHKAD